MKNKYTYLFLAGLVSGTVAIAQDTEVEDPNFFSPGEDNVIEKISGDFDEFAGEESQPIVEALRTGSDLSYEVEKEVEVEVPLLDEAGNQVYEVDAEGNPVLDSDGNQIPETTTEIQTVIETVVVENPVDEQGFGNVKISMLMAEEYLSQQGMEGSLENIAGSLFGSDPELADGILEMRAADMGWGEISKELLGVTVGDLMSAKNRATRPEKAMNATKSETGRPEGVGKPETAGRIDRPEKPEKPAKPEKPERPEKPEKPEKPERPERPEKPEKPERPEKPEKPDRPTG